MNSTWQRLFIIYSDKRLCITDGCCVCCLMDYIRNFNLVLFHFLIIKQCMLYGFIVCICIIHNWYPFLWEYLRIYMCVCVCKLFSQFCEAFRIQKIKASGANTQKKMKDCKQKVYHFYFDISSLKNIILCMRRITQLIIHTLWLDKNAFWSPPPPTPPPTAF